MLGVVDYGSSSDEEMDDVQDVKPKRGLNLPPVVPRPKMAMKVKETEVMAEAVPEKHDWEIQLAEKAKEDKRFVKQVHQSQKKKIQAFGVQLTKDESSDDETDMKTTPKTTQPGKSSFKSELLKILPQPKNPILKSKKQPEKRATIMRPSVLRQPAKRPLDSDVQSTSSVAQVVERDSDSEDESDDFFGFKSTKPQVHAPLPDSVLMASSVPEARIFVDEVAPGPARPQPAVSGEQGPSMADIEAKLLGRKNISDREAHALIYQRELAPWGATEQIAREAVLNIVDVSVDEALGPNVRETLLRNLDQKMAAAQPLPELRSGGDRTAKQKHQITHLAKLAVARESQLQQQWADSKAKKRATAQKYGF